MDKNLITIFKKMCEIATKSSLSSLALKKYITRTASGYQVTSSGAKYVRETFNGLYLDRARIELLNAENRRNACVQYDRIKGGAHL